MEVLDRHRPSPAESPKSNTALVATGIATLLLLLLAGCSGAPGTALVVVDVVEMDMYSPESEPATATGPILEAGKTYTLTIEGTYSIWGSEWDFGVCEGVSEAQPMFPSPGSTNGVVGIDAEFYFAIPEGSALCDDPMPFEAGEFKISVDGGLDFDNPDPVVPVGEPTSDHTYVYEFVGQGHPIMFERPDSPSDDNYGVLRITIASN